MSRQSTYQVVDSPEPLWGTKTYDRQAWRTSAACRELDPAVFFPTGPAVSIGEAARRALAVCAGCPVQSECLSFALATNQRFGIWGGRNVDERRRLRKKRRVSAEAAVGATGPAAAAVPTAVAAPVPPDSPMAWGERGMSIEVLAGGAKVCVRGDVDVLTGPVLACALGDASVCAAGVVALDMGAVDFIDLHGLRAIIAGRKVLRSRSSDLVIHNPSSQVLRLLDLMHLSGLVTADR